MMANYKKLGISRATLRGGVYNYIISNSKTLNLDIFYIVLSICDLTVKYHQLNMLL